MSDLTTVIVNGCYQVTLPNEACRVLNIRPGDRLLADVQDDLLLLMSEPEDYVSHLASLHKELWRDVDTTAYLNEERSAWLEADTS